MSGYPPRAAAEAAGIAEWTAASVAGVTAERDEALKEISGWKKIVAGMRLRVEVDELKRRGDTYKDRALALLRQVNIWRHTAGIWERRANNPTDWVVWENGFLKRIPPSAAAESRLADLARLAEAYRQVQREAVAHHRRCVNCLAGQACDEAGSILDEMAKRRAPFWRELDRALETTGAKTD